MCKKKHPNSRRKDRSVKYFQHPHRAKQNCDGPFYSVSIGTDCGCGLPEEEAPNLVRMASRDEGYQSYFYKQPLNETEIQQAIDVINICPIHDLRYGGKDPEIIEKVEPGRSDYIVLNAGGVVLDDSST
jgi:hypothetical protein